CLQKPRDPKLIHKNVIKSLYIHFQAKTCHGGLRWYRRDSSPSGARSVCTCVWVRACERVRWSLKCSCLVVCFLRVPKIKCPCLVRLLISPLWPCLAAVVQYGAPSLIILPAEPHCLNNHTMKKIITIFLVLLTLILSEVHIDYTIYY
uniref:Uncharacterized protein n=1 Tax=Sparus aurata TaxID=8175 RepID=A0A671UZZ3_SPAAU